MTLQRAPRVPVRRLALVTSPLLFLFLTVGCPNLFPPPGDNNDMNDVNDVNDMNDMNDVNDMNDMNDVNEPQTGNSGLTGQYIGSERCSLCHVNTHSDWADTLHAEAYDTLERIGQAGNANCIGCHTVGFGEEGGFVNRATTNDLAGVGCESCHGPARAHVENITDRSQDPVIDISADVCGTCHTGTHHPTFDEFQTSLHAQIDSHVADGIIAGQSGRLNSCGQCHSGDFVYQALIQGETVNDDAFAGVPAEDLNGITCAVCHDPHARTNNAVDPGDGRDFQLRWPEVASPLPTNTVDAVTNPLRYNICGQCHHSRGREWTSTSRGPHHSIQANMYVGEMPVPEDTDPLVLSRVSVHTFANEQCATCHMYRKDFEDELAPAIAGHSFEVNNESCATSGCHPSSAQALQAQTILQTETQSRIDGIKARLGDPATWEYSAEGGPADQSGLSDNILKIRFLLKYVEYDGSLGIHNPAYSRDILDLAEQLLDDEGL